MILVTPESTDSGAALLGSSPTSITYVCAILGNMLGLFSFLTGEAGMMTVPHRVIVKINKVIIDVNLPEQCLTLSIK